MLHFDPRKLKESLGALDPRQRTLFAALCTQRQLALYRVFEQLEGHADRTPEAAFDFVLKHLASSDSSGEEPKQWAQRLASLAKNLDGVTEWKEYAADMLVSVYSAVMSLSDSTPSLPIDAAQAGYRIVDAYVLGKLQEGNDQLVSEVTAEEEEIVLRDSLVQTELQRQRDDLKLAQAWKDWTASSIEGLFARRQRDRMLPIESPAD